jgi:hypothetical protein
MLVLQKDKEKRRTRDEDMVLMSAAVDNLLAKTWPGWGNPFSQKLTKEYCDSLDNYSSVIKRPMDLATIQVALLRGSGLSVVLTTWHITGEVGNRRVQFLGRPA